MGKECRKSIGNIKTKQIKEPLNVPNVTATEYGGTQNETRLLEQFNAIFAENVDIDFQNTDFFLTSASEVLWCVMVNYVFLAMHMK